MFRFGRSQRIEQVQRSLAKLQCVVQGSLVKGSMHMSLLVGADEFIQCFDLIHGLSESRASSWLGIRVSTAFRQRPS